MIFRYGALAFATAGVLAAISGMRHTGPPTTVPPPYADLKSTDPFGAGTSAQSQDRFRIWMPRLAEAGVRWERMGIGWAQVEPKKGRWNWSAVNSYLHTAATHHVFISGILSGSAPWAHRRGFPIHHLAGWSSYVAHLVTHTAGRIDYYEVWNEPSDGDARAYAKTVVAAYNAAKKVNSRVKIGLTVHSVDVLMLQQTIADGAKNHFDYIAVHPYEVFGALRSGEEAVYMHIIPTIRKMLAVYDPAKVKVPIWITEVGMDPSPARPGNLVKAYVMGITEGFARIEWFEAMGEAYHMGLLNNSAQPTRSFMALKHLIYVLGAHPRSEGWVLLNHRDYGFVFRGTAATVLAAWAPPRRTDTVEFGRRVMIMNPVTGATISRRQVRLTNKPILVLGVGAKLLAKAIADRHKRFPWGGNYADAKQVTWTAGKPVIARGLHQLSANRTSRPTTFGGCRACFLGVGSGTSFTVDPNFLSFTPTPITITAEVCQPKGGHAGFNLRYESTTGWKTIGWNAVPGDGKWHTLKWTITNDEFVNDWGYNFSLESDSRKYSQYYLRRVTVTKDAGQ